MSDVLIILWRNDRGTGIAFAQAVAQPTKEVVNEMTESLFLPVIHSHRRTQVPATATPTVTPPATATPITPTATPTATAPAPAGNPSLFLESTWRTSSAGMQEDRNGGLHVSYYFYEAQNDGAPNYAVYAYCASACDTVAGWSKVKLAEDRDVNEVQLALTTTGHPRLLIRATSTVYPDGQIISMRPVTKIVQAVPVGSLAMC
ncbi:MAG: hypothetical protein R2867_03710 [Caldilineaceae bacterium]